MEVTRFCDVHRKPSNLSEIEIDFPSLPYVFMFVSVCECMLIKEGIRTILRLFIKN